LSELAATEVTKLPSGRSKLEDVVSTPINQLQYPQFQLRQVDTKFLEELCSSIKHLGLLQPILVRPVAPKTFEIVFGLHRVEACKKLGLKTIPTIVRSLSPEQAFLARVTENLSRNIYVDPISEARGYIALVDKHYTIGEIAKQIGKSDSYVSDRIGLIRRLHPQVLERIDGGKTLTATHAVLLSRVEDLHRKLELAGLVEKKRLSVRSLEELVRNRLPIKINVVSSDKSDQVALPSRIMQILDVRPGETLYLRLKRKRLVMEAMAS